MFYGSLIFDVSKLLRPAFAQAQISVPQIGASAPLCHSQCKQLCHFSVLCKSISIRIFSIVCAAGAGAPSVVLARSA
jgi:hypothetical protein